VVKLGGLYVLGTERHESRRIDNQLRGRSGRQGDPGESRFYLSLQDDLMRLFNSALTERIMNAANIPDDVPLEAKMVSRGIASAQGQVEARNFEIRKNVLKYDDVMNRQRTVVYDRRHRILAGDDLEGDIAKFQDDVVKSMVGSAYETEGEDSRDPDLEALLTQIRTVFPASITVDDLVEEAGSLKAVTQNMVTQELLADMRLAYQTREDTLGQDMMRQLERRVLLSVMDRKWREHLYEMDYLKEGIGLRAMAQRDPLVEYQREGYQLFLAMDEAIKDETTGYLFNLEVRVETEEAAEAEAGEAETDGQAESQAQPEVKVEVVPRTDQATPDDKTMTEDGASVTVGGGLATKTKTKLVGSGLDGPRRATNLTYTAPSADGEAAPVRRATTSGKAAGKGGGAKGDNELAPAEAYPGTARNAPCPCGSGKKYKMCHGKAS